MGNDILAKQSAVIGCPHCDGRGWRWEVEPKVGPVARGGTITFDALVAHGLERCKAEGREYNIVNGMPWSFDFHGIDVTHENDNCYLLNTTAGTVRVDRPVPKVEPVAWQVHCEPGSEYDFMIFGDLHEAESQCSEGYGEPIPLYPPPAKVEPVADSAERNDTFARSLEFRLPELDAVRAALAAMTIERNAALAQAEASAKDVARYRAAKPLLRSVYMTVDNWNLDYPKAMKHPFTALADAARAEV